MDSATGLKVRVLALTFQLASAVPVPATQIRVQAQVFWGLTTAHDTRQDTIDGGGLPLLRLWGSFSTVLERRLSAGQSSIYLFANL